MTDGWASRWAGGWDASAVRFNHNHAPAGSATGGQFTTSGSSSSSGASKGKSGGKSTPKPVTPHQKHVAHQEHLAHMRQVAAHPGSASPADRARAKAALLAEAKACRVKIATLQTQLKGLKAQEAKAVATAKHAAATAAAAKAGPNAKKSVAHAAAAKKTPAKPSKKASLKTQIAGVEKEIATLTAQAKSDEAAAAKL